MWGDGTGWDHASSLARGIPCLESARGFNSQLDGDESAKGFWVASYTSAQQAAGPGSGGHPHSVSEAPSVQEARFLWHRLGLALADLGRKSREPQRWGGHPRGSEGAGAPPLSTRISTNAQDQSRDAAAPPCSKSPGMAQAASSNPSIGPSCHKPTGYRRLPGGNVGGVRRACRAFIRAITRLGPNSQFTREQSAKLTAHGDGCRRVQRSPQQGFQPQKPVREPPDPSELREPFTLARRLRPEGCGLRLEGSALSDERAEERIFAA